MKKVNKLPQILLTLLILCIPVGALMSLNVRSVNANVPAPNWWSPKTSNSCDYNNYSGSTVDLSNGASPYQGVIPCQPDGGYHLVTFTGSGPSGAQQPEWQCVEMVARYLYQYYGATPQAYYGNELLAKYGGQFSLTAIQNNSGQLPQVGDAISFGDPTQTEPPTYAHTAIVTSVDTTNHKVWILQQNSTPWATQYLTYSGSVVNGLGGSDFSSKTGKYVNGWLHYQGTAPSLQMNAAISPSSPVTMGASFSASYQVYNPGSNQLNLTQLSLWGQDPNGNKFMIYGDNTNGSNIYVGANSYRTLSFSGITFANGCSNCTNGGSYQLIAEWQNVNNGSYSNVNTANGISNTITINVNASTPTPIHIGLKNVGVNVQNNIPQVFRVEPSGNVSTNWQHNANNTWTGWNKMPGGATVASDISVVPNTAGELQAYARGSDNKIYSAWESNPYNGSSWSTWNIMPNTPSNYYFSGMPTAIQQSNGYMDIFVRGADNNVWHMYQTGSSSWSNWTAIATSGQTSFDGDVSIVQNQPGGEQAWMRGTDGHIYSAWESTSGNTSSWSTWVSVGSNSFTFLGNPIAVRESNGYTDVFVRGGNNNIWHDYQNSSGSWSDWTAISTTGQQSFQGEPSVVMNGQAEEQAYARGNDNLIYSAWQTSAGNNGSWTQWSVLSSSTQIAADPTALQLPSGLMDVYGKSLADNSMWHDYQITSGTWSGWEPVSSLVSKTDAGINSNGTTETFKINSNGSISTDINNGTWSGWSTISGNPVSFTTEPSVVLNRDGGLEIFTLGSDSKIYTAWNSASNNSSWSSWVQVPNTPSNYYFSGAPVEVFMQNGYLDIYARGQNNNIWHNTQMEAGSWSGWNTISTSGQVSYQGNPAIVQDNSGGLEAYALGTDNIPYTSWESTEGDTTSWSSWNTMPNTPANTYFSGSPVAIQQPNTYMDVAIRGQNGNMWHQYQTSSSSWSGWIAYSTTGQVTFNGDLALVQYQSGGLQAWAIGSNNQMYSAWEGTVDNESSWSSWNQVASSQSFNANPTALSFGNGLMDIYVKGQDGNIYRDYQTSSSSWSGWAAL